jgi:hypothetical protein
MLEKMLHHKLLKEGEQGQGVVTERHDQASESGTHTFAFLFELRGHIKFPDGTQTEFRSELLSSAKVGEIQEGAIVPVRYDANDHSKVVIDVVALEERRQADVQQTKDWLERNKENAIEQADAQAAAANAEAEGRRNI